jgi:hypothetical protein
MKIIKHKIDSLTKWYHDAIKQKYDYFNQGWGGYYGTYYEFGTGSGNTLIKYLNAMNVFCNKQNILHDKFHIFLFDSFEGLPHSDMEEDNHKEWSKGKFAGSVEHIKSRMDELKINLPNIEFIKGYYSETLNNTLHEKLKLYPPSIVTIDVDYYSSTKTILEYIDKFTITGSLFYFDDIWAFSGNPNYGELKAINEFNNNDSFGYLTPYPVLGLDSNAYIYASKEFEFKS